MKRAKNYLKVRSVDFYHFLHVALNEIFLLKTPGDRVDSGKKNLASHFQLCRLGKRSETRGELGW